jgi:hypothetical protein
LTVSSHKRVKSSDDTARIEAISDSVLWYSAKGNISTNVPKRSKITALYFINQTLPIAYFIENILRGETSPSTAFGLLPPFF